MTHRRVAVSMMVALAVLGACSKKQPVAEPVQPTVNQDSIDAARRAEAERMRQDSIRAAEAAARAAGETADRDARASLAEMVFFEYDQFGISGAAEEVLLRKAAVLRANPSVRIAITGHADERGSIEYNLALGMRRAQAAKDFLVNYGIDANRMEIASLGEQQPLDQGQTEDAFARNRRDEFTVTSGPSMLQAAGGM